MHIRSICLLPGGVLKFGSGEQEMRKSRYCEHAGAFASQSVVNFGSRVCVSFVVCSLKTKKHFSVNKRVQWRDIVLLKENIHKTRKLYISGFNYSVPSSKTVFRSLSRLLERKHLKSFIAPLIMFYAAIYNLKEKLS
jgi:hypothetical protein